MASILIVEDDTHIAETLKRALGIEGYTVLTAATGTDGFAIALDRNPDLVILDVRLPGMDGFTVCKRLREEGFTSPILMLTVLDETKDKVEGLEAGADDYVTKPFALEELLARVRALLRRKNHYRAAIKVEDLEIDPIKRRVTRAGRPIELSPKEFEILEVLARHRGKALGERAIIRKVWGKEEVSPGILRVYMHHLRQKIDKGFSKKLIRTVRGVGYMIDAH